MSSDIIEIIKQTIALQENPVGLYEPYINGNEWRYVKDCLDTGWVSSVGSYVDLFAEELAEKCGMAYAIPTVNGTSALHISLMLAGVEQGDEVLMPALTFVASANAVSYCGATPHFVECEDKSLGIDAQKLGEYLENITKIKQGALYNKATGNRIAAIMPVHIFGHPVDMDSLQKIADSYNIPIIADGAESLGSLYKDKPVSCFAKISAVSFNGNKIITTGGGGAILTDDLDLANRAKHITTVAKLPHKWNFVHDEIGYNYRMPNLNAAMGCAQLERLDDILKIKRKLANKYELLFEDSKDFKFISEPSYARSNYWLNAIYIKSDMDRNYILEKLFKAGLMCRPIWMLMHRLEMYKDCPRMDLPVSKNLEARIINLPSSVKLGINSND